MRNTTLARYSWENYTIIFNQIAGSLERVREIGLFSISSFIGIIMT